MSRREDAAPGTGNRPRTATGHLRDPGFTPRARRTTANGHKRPPWPPWPPFTLGVRRIVRTIASQEAPDIHGRQDPAGARSHRPRPHPASPGTRIAIPTRASPLPPPAINAREIDRPRPTRNRPPPFRPEPGQRCGTPLHAGRPQKAFREAPDPPAACAKPSPTRTPPRDATSASPACGVAWGDASCPYPVSLPPPLPRQLHPCASTGSCARPAN